MNERGRVLVTGASGFMAAHLVLGLLERGYVVRGTVRALHKKDVELLRSLPGAGHRLDLFEADLTRPGSFDEAAAGCLGVMHAASPYTLDVKDPQKDLVDPAVQGTREVLVAAVRSGTVRRVVLTSSMAAITDEPEADHVLSERDWNVKSSLSRNPYYYSKVLAERAAWEFVDREHPGFDLVVMNPFMVIGPSLTSGLNLSNELFVRLLEGAFPAILSMAWGFVDVRDVAEAHLRALEIPTAHGRYICAGEVVSMRSLVRLLLEHGYTGFKLPSFPLDSALGTWVARLASYQQSTGTGQYLRTHLGRIPRYDTTKVRTELGVSFRPASETILDTLADLERWGHVRSRPTGAAPRHAPSR